MKFTIKATDSGKHISVIDRLVNQEKFNEYVDLNAEREVEVGSQDGSTGQVEIRILINGGPNATVFGHSPEIVTAGQVLEISGD